MAIPDWPENERPRERLIALGAAALSDAELLAIFLRTGIRGKSAVEFSRELLQQFGGLRPLLESDFRCFTQTHGLGPAKYAQLKAIMEMARRHLRAKMSRQSIISDPSSTREFFQAWLRDQPREAFACLYLDNRHRIIHCEALFQGTIDGASVYPREVVRRCIEHRAAAVIFAHNHPSGVAEPSQADRQITRRLQDALALVDVRVLDHLVIGDGETTSFAERGLL
jgi:DNA repair protein RadC